MTATLIERTEFGRQVSDLYAHLYDLVYLRVHPLADVLLLESDTPRKEKGWRLHDLLLDLIQELDPGPVAPVYSREWRRYRLMVGRYQNGLEPGVVMQEIAVSKRQYYREHEAAIEAVADLLWEHINTHHPSESPAHIAAPEPPAADHLELLRLEAARTAQAGRYASVAEVARGALTLLGERLRQRDLSIAFTLSDTLPSVAADTAPLRQLLLGMIAYFVERARQATLRLGAEMIGPGLRLTLSVEPATAVRPTTASETMERLDAFGEMAVLAGVEFEPIYAGPLVIGFALDLPVNRLRTVLVVDDNADVLELYQRFLLPHGYRVVTAATAETAFDLAGRLQPFAITLDLMLPGRDGWDVLQMLLNYPDTRRIPVIICSVLKQKELALSLGASAFLEKPVTEQGLLAALRALEAA